MRSLLIVVMVLAIVPAASACDVCGCSIGGNYFGILPQFHKHFVGLRWSEQSFRSTHSLSSAENGIYDSEEHFQTIDLIGRFYPARRVQVLVLVPYHNFHRGETGVQTNSQGLGDVSLMGNHILINSGDSLRQRLRHTLTVGGGLKLPTGRFGSKNQEGELLHENLQPGSGSMDFMLSATYTLRRAYWGLSSDIIGRINTANKNGYHFGNRVSTSAKVFYVKNFSKVTLLPNLGLFTDLSDVSYNGNRYMQETGGTAVLSTIGLDAYFGKFSIGYTIQLPVFEDMAGGLVQNRFRSMATLNYNF